MSYLEPVETVYRFLFESPSYFVGECEGNCFHLVHAFKNWEKGDQVPSDIRSGGSNFALSIRTQPHRKQSIRVERYEWVGEEVTALLGIYFGKLVYNLGPFESGGIFCVPARIKPATIDPNHMAFNSMPRKPDGPGLNLSEAKRLIEWYLHADTDSDTLCILRAAELYRLALETLRSQPHLSLAMFCSAIEAVLPLGSYSEEELYDDELLKVFTRIQNGLSDGNEIVKGLKNRLFQIKRKVVSLANQVLPENFFTQRESESQFGLIKDREDLISRLKKVYDVRSRILHTGDKSGVWHIALSHDRSEIGLGKPVLQDKELAKTIFKSMSLTGLERITFALLRSLLLSKLSSDKTCYPDRFTYGEHPT